MVECGPYSADEMHCFIYSGQVENITKVRNNLMKYYIKLESSLLLSPMYTKTSNSIFIKNKIHLFEYYYNIFWAYLSKLLVLGNKIISSFLKEDFSVISTLNVTQVEERLISNRRRYSNMVMIYLIPLWIFVGIYSVLPLISLYFILPIYFKLVPTKYMLSLEKRIFDINQNEIKLQGIERARQIEISRQAQKERDLAKQLEVKRKKDEQDTLNQFVQKIDHVRANYESTNECYRRNNRADREFVARYSGWLKRQTNGKCIRCGKNDNIHLDHAIFPKNMGGYFIMHHFDGYKVANCIPLCGHCNSSKGQKDYKVFFNTEELIRVLELLKKSNSMLNNYF